MRGDEVPLVSLASKGRGGSCAIQQAFPGSKGREVEEIEEVKQAKEHRYIRPLRRHELTTVSSNLILDLPLS